MPYDISGYGLRVNLRADKTFPAGIEISAFVDDADPTDSPSVQIKDKAVGLNGDLITWAKGSFVPLTLAVIPGSPDDRNLQVLARANRAAKGRRPTLDIITVTTTNGDGTQVRYQRGVITDAPIGDGVASSGRKKTKTYQFAFEDAQ